MPDLTKYILIPTETIIKRRQIAPEYITELLKLGFHEDGKFYIDRTLYRSLLEQKIAEPTLPSNVQMVFNAAKAAAKQIAAGGAKRTPEESQNIISNFCTTCEFYRSSDNRCSKCGCFLALKTQLATEHCPISKW